MGRSPRSSSAMGSSASRSLRHLALMARARRTVLGAPCRRRERGVSQDREQVLQVRPRCIRLAARAPVQELLHDLKAERTIALELRFAEPLIGRALMRKITIGHGVAAHAGALGSVVAGLDVEDEPVLDALPVRLLVIDVG